MSNWWKRLFGWDEEESKIDEKDHLRGTEERYSPLPTVKGHFEDPGRRLEVKMVNQYPENRRSPKAFDNNHSEVAASLSKQPLRKVNTARWDEPAYTRFREHPPQKHQGELRVRHEVSDYGSRMNRMNGIHKKHQKEEIQNNEEIKVHKKAPFRPTTVPSPIYGYKPREKFRIPSNKNEVVPAEVEVVENLIADPKVLTTLTDQSMEQNEFQVAVKNDVIREVENEKSPIVDDLPLQLGIETEQALQIDEISLTDTRYLDVEKVEVIDEEKAEEVIGTDKVANEEIVEEVEFTSESVDNEEGEEEEVVEEHSDEEVGEPKEEPETVRRNSSIPYNVLMYGADRQAQRKRQERLRSATISSNEGRLNPPIQHISIDGRQHEIEESKPVDLKEVTAPIKVPDTKAFTNQLALPIDLFQNPPDDVSNDDAWIDEKQDILDQVLKNFHVNADIVSFVQGPTVTRFEIRLHPGVKVSKVVALTEDIKLSMAAEQIRIAPVAGKSTVGIEIPNEKRKSVYLKKVLQSESFKQSVSPLTAALGIDISGREVVTDLSKMPHGLIAGATGSGKSVCIHSLILSLIYKTDPRSLRLVLIDPKVVELAVYKTLPHLAAPVINQPKDAALALRWAVDEMERRYQAFAACGVRDIKKYNQTVGPEEKWPYIVIIIDELADLMMASPQDVEESICRIAQKARAAGIHLLLATQRPSVDVITGLIKANIPTRIAFGVSSSADSRTILDSGGAERLLGQGDMLFAENGSRDIQRLQGAFVSDEEIDRVTDFFRSWPKPQYLFDPEKLREQRHEIEDEDDELYQDAANFVVEQGQASVSSLQRHFRIGYNRAARLIDCLEANDVISESNGSKPRQVLVTKEMLMDE